MYSKEEHYSIFQSICGPVLRVRFIGRIQDREKRRIPKWDAECAFQNHFKIICGPVLRVRFIRRIQDRKKRRIPKWDAECAFQNHFSIQNHSQKYTMKLFFFSLKHNKARRHLEQGILRADYQYTYYFRNHRFQNDTAALGTQRLFSKTCICFKRLTLTKELSPCVNNHFCRLTT